MTQPDPRDAALARIRQMTDYWEQHLPEVIRTPAVVSAIRAALERAEPAVVSPPADRADLRDRIAAAIWEEAERTIIAEWICCDPVNPKHQLCMQGDAAMRMVRSLIFDGERTLTDAVLAVLPDSRAAALSETERRMLEYALDLADEEVARDGSEFSDDEEDALAELRRLAGEAQQDPCGRPASMAATPCSAGDWCCKGPSEAQQDPAPGGNGPTAEELAGHLAAQRMSVLQGAFRILGWPPLRFELVEDPAAVARSGQPETDEEADRLDIARCARALAGKVHPPHDWEPEPGEGLWRCPGDEPFAI